MAVVARFFSNLVKSIPVFLTKVGTFLVLIFTVGLFAGYLLALFQFSPLLLALPVAAMAVMWYKLDEGVLLLLFLSALVFFFPGLIESLFSSALNLIL